MFLEDSNILVTANPKNGQNINSGEKVEKNRKVSISGSWDNKKSKA